MNSEHLCSFSGGGSLRPKSLCERNLIGSQFGRAAEADTALFGCDAAGTRPLVDQFALELRDASSDRQHHAAGWRCRIGPGFMQRTRARLRRP